MRNKSCFFRAMTSFFSNNPRSSKKLAPVKTKSKHGSNSKNDKALETYWRRKLHCRRPADTSDKSKCVAEVVDLTNDEIPPIRFQIVDEQQNEIPVLIQVIHCSSVERKSSGVCVQNVERSENISNRQNMFVDEVDLLNNEETNSQIQSVSDDQPLGDIVTRTSGSDDEMYDVEEISVDMDSNIEDELYEVKDITPDRTDAAHCVKQTGQIDSVQIVKPKDQNNSVQSDNEAVPEQKRKKRKKLAASLMFTKNEDGLFCCNLCDKKFNSKKYVQLHLLKHKKFGSSENKCSICGRWFSFKKYLERHLKRHFLSTNLIRKMDAAFDNNIAIVDKNLTSNENARSSFIKLISDTRSEIVSLGCGYCDQCFSTQEALVDHCRIHMTDLPFMCNICGSLFKQNASLVYHSRIHYKMIQRVKRKNDNPFVKYILQVYSCRDCDRSYVSWAALNQHRINAHGVPIMIRDGSQNKRKSKNTDGAVETDSATSNNQLRNSDSENAKELQPLVVESSEKLSCNKCTEVFSAKVLLEEHVQNKHNVTYECCHCFRTYQRKYAYEKHMKIHNKTRVLACSVCEKSFAEVQTLKEHIMTHRQLLYSCTCGKSFKCKNAFIRCYVSHIETKQFACKVCGHLLHTDVDDRRHNFGCTKCKKFAAKPK